VKAYLVLCLLLLSAMTCRAKGIAIATAELSGRPCVAISSLTDQTGIAVKSLPGTKQWVACVEDRCGLLKNVFRQGDEMWVAVTELIEALGASAQFDAAKKQVKLTLTPKTDTPAEHTPRLGSLVPNLRLTRLDGSPVSLADFAGKRVIINSWGSW
jgi:hypothetical protein